MMAATVALPDAVRPTAIGQLSDDQLVARYLDSGCSDSVAELVNRHLRHVRAIIFPMVLDHAVTDDLTQETFLRAWRGLNGFRAEASFSTWVTRIAWNVVHDELNRREKRPIPMPAVYLPIDESKQPTKSPESELLRRELDEQISVAIAELSPKLRAAIVLTGLEQMRPQDAAEMEGCTLSTMYWRIHEARRLLELRLAKYFEP